MSKGWLKEKAPALHKFLTRRDKPWPIIREIGIGALAILLLVGLLYGLTAQPLQGGYPVVVVTSGSMMHCQDAMGDVRPGVATLGKDCDAVSYAGLGTIDPGDLVFVRSFGGDDADTLVEDRSRHYGDAGDVLVYRPHQDGRLLTNNGSPVTPIIHRALFYVQVHEDGTYTVRGTSHTRVNDLSALSGLTGESNSPCTVDPAKGRTLGPADSGFVTRGDNNMAADQCTRGIGFGYDLVKPEHILGKARGELPWIGLVKLFVDDMTQGSKNFGNASGEAKAMLTVTVVILVGGPWILDIVLRRRHRRRQEKGGVDGGGDNDPPAPERRKGKGD